MAVMEKTYSHSPAILWNLINDIVEMRKAKTKRDSEESMVVDTEMYGFKTVYIFNVVPSPGGSTVTVKTEGEDDYAKRDVQLMFATIDNMLGPLTKTS